MSDDIRGVVVPGYTVIRRIGVGGFASVFEATQDDIGAPVALKILTTGIGESQAQRRLEREYRSMGRLRDLRGIVPVYGTASTAEGLPVIVMAYMSGGSLLDRIAERGPLSVPDVLHITDVICDALGAAHDAGIHHRDIKPENVLLDRYDEPALSDFGLATIEGMRDASQTAASLSPPHAPPEKFLGDGVRDPVAADIYSLASTLYHLLTGRPPFGTSRDGGIASLILRITGDAAPQIDRDDLPSGLADAVRQGLAKEPTDRPRSAAAFRDLVRRTPDTVPAPPAAGETPRPPIAPATPEPAVADAAPHGGDATRVVPASAPHEPTRIVSADPPDGGGSPRRRWPWVAAAMTAVLVVTTTAIVFGIGPVRTVRNGGQPVRTVRNGGQPVRTGETGSLVGSVSPSGTVDITYVGDYLNSSDYLAQCADAACSDPGDEIGVDTYDGDTAHWTNVRGCFRQFYLESNRPVAGSTPVCG